MSWNPVALLDELADSVAVCEPDGRIVYVNATNERLMGLPRATLLGANLWDLHPDAAGGPLHRAFQRVRETGEREVFEHFHPAYNRWHRTQIHAIYGLVHVVATDITALKRAEHRLNVLAAASRAFARAERDPEAILDLLTRTAAEELGECALANILSGDETTIARLIVHHPDEAAALEIRALFDRPIPIAGSLTERVMESGKPLRHTEIDVEALACEVRPEIAPMVRRTQPKSLLMVPIQVTGRRLGTLTASRLASPRPYDDDDEALLQGLADRASLALENAQVLTTLSETNRTLKHAEEVARAASRRKDEFLALLGHELRNPLAPIVTALHLLSRKGELNAPRELGVIERHTRHLIRLLDDLLDISRLTHGAVELQKGRLDLGELLDRAIETVGPLLAGRLQLENSGHPHSVFVEGDEVRLSQVFEKLLTNAAHYTPAGGHIRVRLSRSERDALVEVEDDGDGIPPDLLPLLFEPFVQKRRSIHRLQGGLGLGLALVRSLVQLHGGTVAASSEGPGLGSRFVVTLPLMPGRRASTTPPLPERGPSTVPPRHGAAIAPVAKRPGLGPTAGR